MRCVEGRVRTVTACKSEYVLSNVSVPSCCLEAARDGCTSESAVGSAAHPKDPESKGPPSSAKWDEGTVLVDVHVRQGRIVAINPAAVPTTGSSKSPFRALVPSFLTRVFPALLPRRVDCEEAFALPTFVDLHTHIDKGHTAERSTNMLGSLSGADRSTAADAAFWSAADVEQRMDFSLKCAYAHGTSALRTHLINMTAKHIELTWPAFSKIRDRWKGRVTVQGVALVVLSFFRDEAAAVRLAE